MRKTFLTVEYAFPFVKSRQEVIAFEEKELTPIEVAIETIESRAASLETITLAKPVNIKLLQLQLQVCAWLFCLVVTDGFRAVSVFL